ncbi:MAG: phosphatidylserine decarboxylase, partial [Proteobacteria bacterium]|nr:phosphatidylserine decarboxylase [Pseudomonadota bacterium]
MKKARYSIRFYFAILLVTGLLFFANSSFAQETQHKSITQDLIKLMQSHPEIGPMLEASIAEAKKNNHDPKTNPVQSLSQYYDYIDSAS